VFEEIFVQPESFLGEEEDRRDNEDLSVADDYYQIGCPSMLRCLEASEHQ
jgi:hypothetical protein